MEEFYEVLEKRTENAKKVVFMGIGEEKLTDDAFGPYVIMNLLGYSNEKAIFLNAGTDPMSRIDEIINFNPSHLILIDTCTLNKPPGTLAIIERKQLFELVPISSHTIPVHIVIDLINEKLPEIDSFMIGVVPKSLEGFKDLKISKKRESALLETIDNIELPFFEITLSNVIQRVADQLIDMIKKLIKK